MSFGKCLQCGEETNNPKFCSISCSAKFNNLKRRKPLTNCINCGKEVSKKGYRNSKIKFCSGKCQKDYQRKTKLKKWILGEWDGFTGKGKYKTLSDIIRNYVLEKQKHTCNFCKNSKWFGEDIPLEIHHKDGNWKNNSPDNLEALCPTCHVIENRQISFSNNSPDEYRTKSRENRNKEGNGFFRG